MVPVLTVKFFRQVLQWYWGGLPRGLPVADGVALAVGATHAVRPPLRYEPRLSLCVITELLQGSLECDALAV